MSYKSMKLELISFVPELNGIQAGVRLNRSYQHLLDLHPWSFKKGDGLVATVAPITAGTITVANGATTVAGTGTGWTSAVIGRYFKAESAFVYYRITNFAAPQTITLELAFNESSITDGNYSIFQDHYSKPTDCADIQNVRYNTNLVRLTKNYIDTYDPNRDSTGEPYGWLDIDASVFQVWPVPDQAYTLRVWYNKSFADMSLEADVPVIPAAVVVAHARQEACLQLATSPGTETALAAHYLSVYNMMTQDQGPTSFRSLYMAAIEEDTRKLTLPRTVITVESGERSDNTWLLSHDPYDPRRP